MIPSQKEILAIHSRECRPDFNKDLFERSTEKIVECLQKVIQSICVESVYFSIKVSNFEVVTDYNRIKEIMYDYGEMYKSRNKNKSKDNMYDYIDIKPTNFIILLVTYDLSAKGETLRLTVPIGVPMIVNKYYMNLQGNLYLPQLQIVDASTYNNSLSKSKYQSVTLKTLSPPIRMYRHTIKLMTTDLLWVNATYFDLNAFRKTSRSFKYILAKYGFMGTFQFLGLEGIYVYDEAHMPPMDDNFYIFHNKDNPIFKTNNPKVGVYIQVSKYLYDNDVVTQNMVVTLLEATGLLDTFDDILTVGFWRRALGNDFKSDTVEKGLSILASFEGILDIITKETLHLPPEMKENMYCLLKWMVCEFSSLRAKDNLNILTKRIRIAEYIAALYATKLNTGLYRMPDIGQRVTIDMIRKAINIDPMHLIKEIAKCSLITFDNIVTDCDSTEITKFSVKGQSGLGDNNSKSIPWAYRYSHESYLGVVDLDATSASDPGVTGIICPNAKLYDGSFSEFEEPNEWPMMYKKLLDEFHRLCNVKNALFMKNAVTGEDVRDQVETVNMILDMTADNLRLIDDIMNERSVNTRICPFVDIRDGRLILQPVDIVNTKI